jgi:hypothetical protein
VTILDHRVTLFSCNQLRAYRCRLSGAVAGEILTAKPGDIAMERFGRLVAVACAAFALGGCVSMSRSSAELAAPLDVAREGRVEVVNLDYATVMQKVGGDFATIFTAQVKKQLDRCATGSRPLRLDASVTQYFRTHPLFTAALVGRNRIRGTAVLTDVQTGRVVGRYRIGKTIIGGRFGIVAMGPAQTQLSAAFGDEVCRQAFAARPAA